MPNEKTAKHFVFDKFSEQLLGPFYDEGVRYRAAVDHCVETGRKPEDLTWRSTDEDGKESNGIFNAKSMNEDIWSYSNIIRPYEDQMDELSDLVSKLRGMQKDLDQRIAVAMRSATTKGDINQLMGVLAGLPQAHGALPVLRVLADTLPESE